MLLQKLSEATGVSGNEEPVRALLLEAVRGLADECRIDTMGNMIVLRRGTGGSPLRVMVAAHMDEIGLMITQIEDNGVLHFAKVGGIDDRLLPAKPVLIGPRKVNGVVTFKPVHLTEKGERDTVVSWKQLCIDIGAASRAEAEKLVQKGDTAVFATDYCELDTAAGGWRTVAGKAFDDRAGCAVVAELLEDRYPFDLYAVFTVQEEVGLRGARTAAFSVKPDCGIAVDCTGANETPKKKDLSPSTRLGEGPAITIRDNSFIADPRLVDLFFSTGSRLGIPCQSKMPNVGGTDAGAIHMTHEGVPSITMAVPCRYIHAPKGILSLRDFENTVRLGREALRRLPETMKQ